MHASSASSTTGKRLGENVNWGVPRDEPWPCSCAGGLSGAVVCDVLTKGAVITNSRVAILGSAGRSIHPSECGKKHNRQHVNRLPETLEVRGPSSRCKKQSLAAVACVERLMCRLSPLASGPKNPGKMMRCVALLITINNSVASYRVSISILCSSFEKTERDNSSELLPHPAPVSGNRDSTLPPHR
jgi:hypothetical protein